MKIWEKPTLEINFGCLQEWFYKEEGPYHSIVRALYLYVSNKILLDFKMEGSGEQSYVGSGCVCICGFEALGSCRWGLPFTCHNPKKKSGSVLDLEILINTKY